MRDEAFNGDLELYSAYNGHRAASTSAAAAGADPECPSPEPTEES